jgi:rRNA maturation endonuclease Nob1
MPVNAKSDKRKSERIGEIRCQNCRSRFRPTPGAQKATCEECGMQWRISWAGDLAKIRKPDWESWERTISETGPTKE